MAKNLFVLSGAARRRVLNKGMIGYRVEHPVEGSDKVVMLISYSVLQEAGMKVGDRVQPVWDSERGEMILEKNAVGFKIMKPCKESVNGNGKLVFTYKKNMGIPDITKRVDVAPIFTGNGKIVFCLKKN